MQSAAPFPESTSVATPVAGGDVYVFPASYAQKGLWLVDQISAGNTAYNLPILWRVAGPLKLALLERTLDEIVRRHEILRTTLWRRHGELVQVIAPASPFRLVEGDLSRVPEAEREARALEQALEETRRPFDLAEGPLFRAHVWKLGERDHLLLLDLHHVVADGWSIRVLYREIAVLYEAFGKGHSSPLPDLPLQYADFSEWQRQQMQDPALEGHLAFWRRTLAGAPSLLDLPTDRARSPRQTFSGGSEALVLSPMLARRVREVAKGQGVTPYMTLLAAFATLLHRHTGQTDLVVGSPVANRTRVELESLIGLVMNTLVLRIDISGDPSFRELLERVRRVCLDAYAHQDMPFEKLLEEMNPGRTLSYSPLFQVLMTLQSASEPAPSFADLRVSPLSTPVETAKVDLAAYFEDRGEEITASFEYNTDLFEASTIRWMLKHFRTLLDDALADLEMPVSRLQVVTDAEFLATRAETNRVAPSNPFPEFRREEIEQSIPERFEQQVRRDGIRVAARSSTQSWTYEKLARETDRAARAVLELAPSGPQRVALLFEQDVPMLAAMLGTLKAGKTYVPLDPSFPLARLKYMLEDTGASVILTHDRHIDLAESLASGSCRAANLDRLRPSGPAPAPPIRIDPSTPAYILYTSGSTGQPKGVVQSHRNLLHFIRAYSNRLHLRPEDRLSLLASYGFDAAVMDIFGALLNGATLCLWNFKAQGVSGLSDWIGREQVSVLHAVPTVFRAFAASLKERQSFPTVRLIVLGGEEVHRGDVEIYRRHFSRDCLLVNGLGPTESTVALQYFVDHETVLHRQTVPVGYPVNDTAIVLLDPAGRPTEIHGEIGIRSPHVALGYWNKPELTASAFLPDPDGGTQRIYLTGDLGRRLPNGAIEFTGRKGSRVKVRGHRIELREIEENLHLHDAIREAVVAVRDDAAGEHLVAYLALDRGPRPAAGELRKFLGERLPDFMIPSAFVWLESFPLTPTGKVDRAALPAPEEEASSESRAFVGPRTVLESQLVRIWERVLNVRSIGVTDNFFDLGGHSLLAVHLLTLVEKETGRTLPLSVFFQSQTVADMAARLEENREPSSWSSLLAIQPEGSRPPFFCVHAQGGDAFEYRVFVQHLGSDQPLYGLSPRGLDGREDPHDRVEEMAAHYVREIREAQAEGPYYLGGWSFGGVVAFEMARQLREAGEEIALLALFDTHRRPPERPSRPPLRALVWQRLAFHTAAVRRLEPGKRGPYVLSRFGSALAWIGSWFSRWLGTWKRTLRPAEPGAYEKVRAANEAAARRYSPHPYDGTITLFRATGMGLASSDDPYLGWGEVPGVDVEVIEVPGVHRSILREEADIRSLAQKLWERLRQAQEEAAP